MNKKLKTCPFCGSPASIWSREDRVGADGLSFVVCCDNNKCGCSYGRDMSLTERMVINRWNKRSEALKEAENG